MLWNNGLTPWDDVIHVHLAVDVVNFHNEKVEKYSLYQHPTESGHQEILHQSCYCNTGSLWKERVFVYLWRSFRQDIYGATGKFVPWIEKGATNFVFCGVYSSEEDDLSSSKGHRNTHSNLRERLTNISDEIVKKNSNNNKNKKNELEKSNNNNNNNTLKTLSTRKKRIELIKMYSKIWPKKSSKILTANERKKLGK